MEPILLAAELKNSNIIPYLGMEWMDWEDFWKLLIRFAINTFFIAIVARGIYYKVQRRKEYLFTFFLISTTIFMLCFLLDNVKLQLGFALGLFAIFGIIRYRTDAIPIKEMTYLFVVIGIAVINALSNKKISYAEMIFVDIAIVTSCYLLENFWWARQETSKEIIYEKIELIRPENQDKMKQDLEERTGLVISRVEIGNIDYLRDIANIRIFYVQKHQNGYGSGEVKSETETSMNE